MYKRFLCLFFAVLILVSSFSVSASSAEDSTTSGLSDDFDLVNSAEGIYMYKSLYPTVDASVICPSASGKVHCTKEDFLLLPWNRFKALVGSDYLDDKFYIVTCKPTNTYYLLELLICDSFNFDGFDINGTGNVEKWFYYSNNPTWQFSTEDNSNYPYSIYCSDFLVRRVKDNAGYYQKLVDTRYLTILYSNFYTSSDNPNGFFHSNYYNYAGFNVFPISGTTSPNNPSDFEFIDLEDVLKNDDIVSPWHWEPDPDGSFYGILGPLSSILNFLLDLLYKIYTFLKLFIYQYYAFAVKVLAGEISLGEAFKSFFSGLFNNLLSGIKTVFSIPALVTSLSAELVKLFNDLYYNLWAYFLNSYSRMNSMWSDFIAFLFVPTEFSFNDWYNEIITKFVSNFPILTHLSKVFNAYSQSGGRLNISSSFMGHEFVIDDTFFSPFRTFVRNGLKLIFGVSTLLVIWRMISSAFGVSLGGILGNSSSGPDFTDRDGTKYRLDV